MIDVPQRHDFVYETPEGDQDAAIHDAIMHSGALVAASAQAVAAAVARGMAPADAEAVYGVAAAAAADDPDDPLEDLFHPDLLGGDQT